VVKIRLARFGSKKNPIYRLVVTDSRSPRDGAALEYIGRYNPQTHPSLIEVDGERAKHWLANGAQPSQPAKRLMQKAGVL
jgi:small subunit ribosomal protein S16